MYDSLNTAQTEFTDLPNIKNEPRFDSSVKQIFPVIANCSVIRLERPQDFTFIPGQYVWLVLPEYSFKIGSIDRRAYYITSAPDAPYIELYVYLGLTDFLAAVQKLHVGQAIQIIGPFGSSILSEEKKSICVAGGTGIAPFMSMIRTNTFNYHTLMVYNNDPQVPYYKDEITESSQSGRFRVNFVNNEPHEDDFKNILHEFGDRDFYISGSQKFVDTITEILNNLKVNHHQLHYGSQYPSSKDDIALESILGPIITNGMIKSVLGDVKQDNPQLEDLLFQIIRQASNHLIVTNRNGNILFANAAAQNLTGYSFREMYHQTPRLWGGLMPLNTYKTLWQHGSEGQIVSQQLINRTKNGRLYVAIIRITPITFNNRIIAFVATEEDITQMQQIDRAKTEFVSLASHQLRTPLSAMNWYIELLLSGDAGQISGKQEEYLKEVNAANQRMVTLINDLLNVSRLELDTFRLEPEGFDPTVAANQIIKEIQTMIQQKNQRFTSKFDPRTPKIIFDKKYFDMIFQNLLSNASKYTPAGGTITLVVAPVKKDDNVSNKKIPDSGIMIQVTDTGYGIPVNAQNKIFTKMFRAKNVSKLVTDGTGLGLYIIKSVIDRSNGMIWFESTEGKGSTFYVYLPLFTYRKTGSVKLS